MFQKRGIKPEAFAGRGRFDPPYGGVGSVFPISGGLLQTAGLKEDLLTRRGDRRRGQGRVRRDHQRVRRRPCRHPAARRSVLPGLLRGRGHDQRRDHAPAAHPGEQLRQEPPGRASPTRSWPRSASAVETYRDLDLSREYRRRRADPGRLGHARGAGGDPPPHGQVHGPRTCSTAAPAATTPAWTTPTPSTPGWPTPRCACPTPSSSCAPPTTSWRSRTARSRRPRRPSSAPASWPAWASWPPASPTR